MSDEHLSSALGALEVFWWDPNDDQYEVPPGVPARQLEHVLNKMNAYLKEEKTKSHSGLQFNMCVIILATKFLMSQNPETDPVSFRARWRLLINILHLFNENNGSVEHEVLFEKFVKPFVAADASPK